MDVGDVMSENVEDSDDVLEPDDGERSDTIGGCRDNITGSNHRNIINHTVISRDQHRVS